MWQFFVWSSVLYPVDDQIIHLCWLKLMRSCHVGKNHSYSYFLLLGISDHDFIIKLRLVAVVVNTKKRMTQIFIMSWSIEVKKLWRTYFSISVRKFFQYSSDNDIAHDSMIYRRITNSIHRWNKMTTFFKTIIDRQLLSPRYAFFILNSSELTYIFHV